MANPTIEEIAARLRGIPEKKDSGVPTVPVVPEIESGHEQIMMLSLVMIHPYEHNPRHIRNELYDEIKESIRERGLESPLIVTRRPNQDFYVLMHGGNTRLQCLKELNREAPDGRFAKVPCFIKPYPGEIGILTSHLIENEKRGPLVFIDRARAVVYLNSLYDEECNHQLSQRELAQRLAKDGCAVSQSHISRYKDAVNFLLPVIPNLLDAGMGIDGAKRMLAFRHECERCWNQYLPDHPEAGEFEVFYNSVMVEFNNTPLAEFNHDICEDELLAGMAERFHDHFNTIEAVVRDKETRQNLLNILCTTQTSEFQPLKVPPPTQPAPPPIGSFSSRETACVEPADDDEDDTFYPDVEPQDRVHSIQTLVNDQLGEEDYVDDDELPTPPPPIEPIRVDGRYPFGEAEVWVIGTELDDADALIENIYQLALEIGASMGFENRLTQTGEGTGFMLKLPGEEVMRQWNTSSRLAFLLLRDLSGHQGQLLPLASMGKLFCGPSEEEFHRLDDITVLRFVRLIRLIRRLNDHVARPANTDAANGEDSSDVVEVAQ
jgi:ParB family protein of integrating conjugative element (PFGI_1 class)